MTKKEPLYITQERARINKMSNQELFDEFLDAQIPDSWDGEFTSRGDAVALLYLECLRTRLENWLKK
jgi:hypothetical protein